jgi:putative ABC transport system permease protein
MLRNYLITTFRNILRHKGYSAINIFGLAIGMACCLLFSLYYLEETSFDRYLADYERVFRIAQVSQPWVDETSSAITTAPLAPLLKEKFPQVELVARAMPRRDIVVKRGQNSFYESDVFWSEPELFGVLAIPFIEGDSQTALNRPNTVVMCEELAQKYFGATSPIGQTLRIGATDYEITGVVSNAPQHTHFKYTMFISLKTIEDVFPYFSEWGFASFYTYVKLLPGVDVAALTIAVNKETLPFTAAAGGQDSTAFVFQPIASIHLQSHLRSELGHPGSPMMLTIVVLVGILVLGIACLNFANLTTARSSLRAKEMALRKTVGAERGRLIYQLLGESVILSAIAFAVAVTIVDLLLPTVRTITGAELDPRGFVQPSIILLTLAMVVGIGLIAGLYPAFILTAFKPAAVLKGTSSGNLRKARARWLLVTGQLAITVVFVAFSVTVFSQIRHMQQIPLGFSSGDRMVARITLRRGQDYRSFKQELQRLPEIAGVTASSEVPGVEFPGYWDTWLTTADSGTVYPMTYLYCDEDFTREYDIAVVAGRGFSQESVADSARSCLINQAAARVLGFDSPENAIGAEIFCGTSEYRRTIVGVTDDFHFQGLQKTVEPLVIDCDPSGTQYLSLRLQPGNTQASVTAVSSFWQKMFPDNPLDWFLLDDQFNRQYQAEESFGRLLLAATGLGLVIACMGLLGLTAFAAARRTKEIGIRKVLGAGSTHVVGLLGRDLAKALILAYVIAWPVGYWVINRWLQNFAYRTSFGVGIILLSSLAVLLIAVLTASYQTIRAARANPVEALRYE